MSLYGQKKYCQLLVGKRPFIGRKTSIYW